MLFNLFGYMSEYYRDMRMLFHNPDGAGGYRSKMNQRKRRKVQRRVGNGRRRKK